MRGSLVVTFDETIADLGGNYYTVTVNGVERYRGYFPMDNLYSTKINVGDIVQLRAFGEVGLDASFNTIRLDYTTDDENGDRGIKETTITSATGSTNTTTVTFTGATRPDAYGFEYRANIGVVNCFNIGLGFENTLFPPIRSSAIREVKYYNDRIYIGGRFNKYNGNNQYLFTVLNNSGEVNGNFVPNLFPNINSDYQVNSIQFQSDGKIICGGFFDTYSGVSRGNIVKINTNYTVDTGFTVGNGFNTQVYDVEIQSDGKILAGGGFNTYNFTNVNRIVRLNSDGSLDGTFTSSITGGTIYDIEIQSDGKILVCGFFLTVSGINRSIRRLNSDGSVDGTFNSVDVSGIAFQCKVLSDGKILVVGQLSIASPLIGVGLLRLNSDGTVDNTFNVSTDTLYITALALQNDNKIVVHKNNQVGFINQSFLQRYNSDGTVDTTFNQVKTNQTEALIQGESIAIKPNGNILFGGNFQTTEFGAFADLIEVTSEGQSVMCGSGVSELLTELSEAITTENEDNLIIDF